MHCFLESPIADVAIAPFIRFSDIHPAAIFQIDERQFTGRQLEEVEMTRKNACLLWRWVLLFTAVLSSGYCQIVWAADRPSHETALSQIRRAVPDSYAIALTNFKYANGYSLDANRYVVVVTFKLTTKISSDPSKSKQSFNKDLQSGMNAFGEIVLTMALGHFEPGDSFDEAEEFIFLNTENGWIYQGPKGDAQVTARHTPNADAVDQQVEQAKKARQEEGRREAEEFHKSLQAKNDAIAQACAAGRQMHVATGPLHLQNMQGGGTLDQWVYAGQVVSPIPGDNRPYMCHVQYIARGHVISGYIDVNQLALN